MQFPFTEERNQSATVNFEDTNSSVGLRQKEWGQSPPKMIKNLQTVTQCKILIFIIATEIKLGKQRNGVGMKMGTSFT